jgi:hypothetical protein
MKNLIYKGFKKNKLTSKGMVGIILLFTLFISGCFDFNYVNQPYQADPNSYFDVQISAWVEGVEGGGFPRFGVLLPIGWVPQDSISYFIDNSYLVGTLIYSESLSQSMSTIDPPPENCYWWVAYDTTYLSYGTFNFDLRIYTDAQTGTFFIDYMLGGYEIPGLNYRRSNEHLIIIGEPQGCAPEGIVLSTQAEVDSFPFNYPACSQIAGNFSISGNDITNLNGLNGLTQIGGSLRIENNTTLTSLIGLNDLTAVGGSFFVTGNSLLEDLSGLNNLTTIERHFRVDTNQLLTDFSGLENLVFVGRDFQIVNNNALASLTGLEGITSIGGNLTINNNSLLCNCELEVICAYLSNPNGTVKISNNSPGCNSMLEVAGACNLTLPCQQNYSFTSQIDINYFPFVYPNCNEIEGNVTIMGSSITNLDGLSIVSSIGGNLRIMSNANLTSLAGLESLNSIGGYLTISNNISLSTCNADWLCEYLAAPTGGVNISNNAPGCNGIIDVAYACGGLPCLPPYFTYIFNSQSDIDNFQAAFPNCSELQGNVIISGSDITDLSGLYMVTSIGSYLRIESNSALVSLTGLENLTSIGSYLRIKSNNALTSLTGLENLTSIGDYLSIYNNGALISLTGLESLTSIGSYLQIGDYYAYGNPALTSLTGLESLNSIGSYLLIGSNTALTSLTGLENLTSIGDYLSIWSNNALTSLTGLENLTSIGEFLSIYNNGALISLTGLESLTSIGGYLSIRSNNALTSLTGLENLTSIGGSLVIGGYIDGNPQLTSLTGLENLTSIGGSLEIVSNNALTSLTGLDNIAANSITNLYIHNNSSLSTCEVQSICDYLAAPNGTVTISNNAPGCNSQAQVIAACATVGIDEAVAGSGFSIFPNPFTGQLSIEFNLPQASMVSIQIFNAMGARVAELHHGQLPAGQQQFTWHADDLPKGMYFCRVQFDRQLTTQKLIKL